MDRAIVTFHDPKTGQNIIWNFTHNPETQDLDYKVRFDPAPDEDAVIGFNGILSEIFINALASNGNQEDNTPGSNSGESSIRD